MGDRSHSEANVSKSAFFIGIDSRPSRALVLNMSLQRPTSRHLLCSMCKNTSCFCMSMLQPEPPLSTFASRPGLRLQGPLSRVSTGARGIPGPSIATLAIVHKRCPGMIQLRRSTLVPWRQCPSSRAQAPGAGLSGSMVQTPGSRLPGPGSKAWL